jgi:hypothetical protein
MAISAKIVILITAAGFPAIMFGLGWIEKMTGFSFNNAKMISDGDFWMLLAALIYLFEGIIGVAFYFYRRESG